MKKILFTANTDRHILLCHLPYLKWFKDNSYEVHVATNTDKPIEFVDKKIKLCMKRNPFSVKNLKGIFQLKKIFDENDYSLVHTHTPVGSVVTRFAAAICKKKIKIIYTCHGFHFYKGAPFYFWLLFYPIEKILMSFVDILIVMNKEDYNFAIKHFKCCDVKFINGVGFNKERLDKTVSKLEINRIYKDLNLRKNDFIVSYIAEYSKRKRQIDLINILDKTNIRDTNIKIIFVGDDSLNGRLKKIIQRKNLCDVVKLVEFTNGVNSYYEISNLIISCSRQEGLPLNIMEAIYKKKLLLVSNCRGNVDLVFDGINGFIVDDINSFFEMIIYIKKNYKKIMRGYQQGIDISNYTNEIILKEVVEFYKDFL